MAFYEFDQNNSGGYFEVNDNVCHRLFIEANSFEEAVNKAESLGCYWNGVENGFDCPCCGDRWYKNDDIVDIERYSSEGYEVSVYDGIYKNTREEWYKRYGKYEIMEEPKMINNQYSTSFFGKIRFKNIEEFAQYMADEYGWTSPDARIFYINGEVKEIFVRKME